jgi:hypothetical protein
MRRKRKQDYKINQVGQKSKRDEKRARRKSSSETRKQVVVHRAKPMQSKGQGKNRQKKTERRSIPNAKHHHLFHKTHHKLNEANTRINR